MNNSESARKLNQAVNNTGRAVGEALSQAKGAFSSFWSTFTTPPTAAAPMATDINSKAQIKVDIDPKEATEAKEDVVKKKFHNNDSKQQKDTPTKSDGIVEIGREAGTLDANKRSNEVI